MVTKFQNKYSRVSITIIVTNLYQLCITLFCQQMCTVLQCLHSSTQISLPPSKIWLTLLPVNNPQIGGLGCLGSKSFHADLRTGRCSVWISQSLTSSKVKAVFRQAPHNDMDSVKL
jgi:hypothetical protein